MRTKIAVTTVSVIISLLISIPAGSTIYTWQDQNGTTSFSDDPKSAPNGAEVKVWSNYSAPQTASYNNSSEPIPESTQPPMPEQQPMAAPTPATQGEFAIQLVTELGLGRPRSPEEASDLLTRIRIAPPFGRWDFNAPMTPELTARFRTLTVAATQMGWLTLTPEQALLSFDTTAALLGVVIPTDPNPTTARLPYPNAEIPPPLVYVTPPPPVIFSYYTWVPVVDGFWWGDTWFGGFFVLTTFHHHEFRHHRFFIDHEIVEHRFHDHIVDHRFGREPGSRSLRGWRTPVAPPAPNRTVDPAPRPHLRSTVPQPPPAGIHAGIPPLSQIGEGARIHPPPSLPSAASPRTRVAPPLVPSNRPDHPPVIGASPSTRPPVMNRIAPSSPGGSPHGQPPLRSAGRATGQNRRLRS